MKRLFTLLLISFAALSCEMIDEKLDDLLDKRDWVIFAEGTELTVDVPSKQTVLNYKFESTLDWEVKTDAEWLEIDPTSGKTGKDIKIQIKVLHNKDKEGRTGYADLTLSNDESYRITINQAGDGNENDEGDENDEGTIVDIPANQIWYTSTDGEIVEPYSGIENNYADFGVNIVSNTYVDGKGVIEFDGDVTTIGDWAFNSCSSLTSITIPDSVTTIGNYAFALCSNLQEFKGKFASEDGRCLIVDGVLNSFAIGCGATDYTIHDSVTTIGRFAFAECSSLTSVTIPDSVTTIGDYAFSNCRSLTSVIIPDSVTTIGYAAFGECYSLTSATIPDSVTTIEDYAFRVCYSLTSVTIPDSVTTIGDYTFLGCSSLTSVIIGDSVTTIGDYAFAECSSLTSVTIPDSVTTIGNSAFDCCWSLTSVTIPDSVTTIGSSAFNGCSSLQEFKGKFASEDGRCLIIDGTLNSFAPAGLTEYTIPDSVTTIGRSAFNGCSSLTSVTIPNSVTTIGDYAFYGCSSLTSVTIGDSVTTIGEYAFRDCRSLTSVTIPDSVTTIGNYAFYYCSSLTSGYCKAITPPAGGCGLFDSNASGLKIYVPMESVEAYKSADCWSEYASSIEGYNF